MKKIAWKIYAIIYALLTIAGFFMVINTMASWNFGSWESMIESIILAIGTLIFSYGKVFLNNKVWKSIFIAILAIWIANAVSHFLGLSDFILQANIKSDTTTFFVGIIISIPALISIYKLGFLKNKNIN